MWSKSHVLEEYPKKKSLFEPSPYQSGYTESAAVPLYPQHQIVPSLNLTHIGAPLHSKLTNKQPISKYGQYSERKRYSDYVTASRGDDQRALGLASFLDPAKSQRSSHTTNDSGSSRQFREQPGRQLSNTTQSTLSALTRSLIISDIATQLSPRSSNKASKEHIDSYKQLLSPRSSRYTSGSGMLGMMKSFSSKDPCYTSGSCYGEEAKENCTEAAAFRLKEDLASPRNSKYFKKDPAKEKRCYNTPRDSIDENSHASDAKLPKCIVDPQNKPILTKLHSETNIKHKSTFGDYIKQKITPSTDPSPQPLYFSGAFSGARSRTDLHAATCSQQLPQLSIADFALGKCRGDGKFSRVYPCRHRSTGTLYALKEIPKSIIKKNSLEKQLTWEVKIQMFFQHVNIVRLYGFFADATNVYLLMEYMEGGTLFDYLKRQNNGRGLPEEEVCKRMREVCSAVYYMHDLEVAHRDIKPQNIVLSNGVAKLCDFGWSTLTHERRSTYCGTFDYSSPEMLEGKEYDQSIDLWSLGVLAYELLTGKLPFYSASRKETIKNITSVDDKNLVFPANMSWEARSFIEGLLKKEPDQRREAEMLLRHPFLAKYKERLY